MDRRHIRARGSAAALAGALAVGLAACAPDPTDFHSEEEVDRIELISGGATLATWEAESDAWTGTLTVGAGSQTGLIEVVLFDHDGEELVFDADHYLEVAVGDESIATFEQDGPGSFTGRLRGLQAGATTVTLHLMHGAHPSGHPEEETSALAVTVS